MQLNFTVMQEITTGDFPAAYHDQDGIVSVYTVQDGHIHQIQTQPELGEWDGLLFSPATTVGVDESIENIKVRGLPHEKLWFTWKSGDLRMIAPWPDDSPPYELLDPYRLYYAVDSEKLYQNINQRWQFIATHRHDLMKNIGTKTHDEIEALLQELEVRISALEGK